MMTRKRPHKNSKRLPAKAEAFAQQFAKSGNITASFQWAYQPGAELSARHAANGKRLLRVPKVAARVEEIRVERNRLAAVDVAAVIEVWKSLIVSDPEELSRHRVGACRHCWGRDHLYMWRKHEYVTAMKDAQWEIETDPGKNTRLPDIGGGLGYDHTRKPHPDCPECHGEGVGRVVPIDTRNLSPAARLLFGGIKRTKYGPEIIVGDRMKALDALTRILGAYKDERSSPTQNLFQMVQFVEANVTNPQEAAHIYEQMVRGMSVNPPNGNQQLLTGPS